MNTELFASLEALTFDDVLVVPGYTEVLPAQTDVHACLGPGLDLNIPLLSAAMDTVTEARLAIAIAREGGMGVIHRNLSPEAQAGEVDKVKRSQSGMIVEPITLPPDASVRQAEEIMSTYHISGVPVTAPDGRLVGILTNRDVRFLEDADLDSPISKYMTPRPLVTAPVGIALLDAKRLLQQHRIEKLPLVDENGSLKGLLTVKDIQKARDFPNAAHDSQGRLLVGAAVGVGPDLETRAQCLANEEVDAVVIDTAHGHSAGVIQAIQRLRRNWPDLPVIAGNVVTAEGAEAVMLGSLLSGLDESPGNIVHYEGRRFKEYRGMGSLGAMQGFGRDRYASGQSGSGKLVPEGIEGRIPYKGPLSDYVFQLVGGLRSGMGYAGAARLDDLHANTRLVRITNAGLIESHPHDVIITREAPNYQVNS